jgi:predicted DNA-binding transcriptional regulator YafY
MLRTSVRVLRLLTVLQARRSWSGADLAEQLDVTPRTLRRDVDRLRDLGYPVQSTTGTAGGYSLGQGAFLPPLMLDDDEGVAVAVALHVAAGSSVTGIEGASQRAMAKLERVLPERLRRRSKSLRSSLLRLAEAGPTVELASVAALAAACAANRGVAFVYRDHGGVSTKRSVEPHRVVHMDRRWYLVAWDTAKRGWRTFRVDRIAPPIAETAHFTPRDAPDSDLATYVTRAVSSGPYRHSVRVVLHAATDAMRARISPSEGLLEAIDDRSCRLIFGTNSFVTTAAWLAGLDVDFAIEEPHELALHVRRLAARFGRAAKVPVTSS